MQKHFISSQALLEDSFKLAAKVLEDEFTPNFIIGVWRGGAPIGIAVQEYFDYQGIKTDHIAIRTSAYEGIDKQKKQISVHGLHYIVDHAKSEDSLLIVDDVFDTGRSIEAVLEQLKVQMGNNMPGNIRVACPWYKPENCQVKLSPDYFLYTTSKWLVFPHELSGLTAEEIKEHKKDLINIHDLL